MGPFLLCVHWSIGLFSVVESSFLRKLFPLQLKINLPRSGGCELKSGNFNSRWRKGTCGKRILAVYQQVIPLQSTPHSPYIQLLPTYDHSIQLDHSKGYSKIVLVTVSKKTYLRSSALVLPLLVLIICPPCALFLLVILVFPYILLACLLVQEACLMFY